jgi:hypothetical protein
VELGLGNGLLWLVIGGLAAVIVLFLIGVLA